MTKHILHIIIILFFLASCNTKKVKQQENNKGNSMQGMNMDDKQEMKNDSGMIDTDLQNVTQLANKSVISKVETIHPVVKEFTQTIHADGYIALDERRNNKVSVRTGGRIEKLYMKYNYQYIHKGDKIMDLYSPELNTFQEEYLHHLKTSSDSNLIELTKNKLAFLGLTSAQIKAIETKGQPLQSISIYSAYEGFIFYDNSQQQNSTAENSTSGSSGMNGMGAENSNQSASSNSMQTTDRIQEGAYVNKGQTLFIINDCKEVYAMLSFNAEDAEGIKAKLPVKIKSQLVPNEINATVNFIEPSFKQGQNFFQARVYLKNSEQRLKINSIVSGEIASTENVLAIPASSILSLGNRNFVWLKKGKTSKGSNILQATEVTIGNDFNEHRQIISGINAQDEIAKDAGYLLDSESLIKPE